MLRRERLISGFPLQRVLPKPVIFYSLLSGILLTLCFPKFPFGFLAWIALVPLFIALDGAGSRGRAALAAAGTGFVFFSLSLHWLTFVTTFGWIFVACLETSFLILFGFAAYEGRRISNDFFKIFWIASAWTAFEVLRSEIAVFGFGWNLLAYSQTGDLRIVQGASWAGAYGLGFVIVAVNAAFAAILRNWRHVDGERKIRGLLGMIVAVFLVLLIYGHSRLSRPAAPSGILKISLIQGNISQSIKWVPEAREKIVEIYSKLSTLAGYDDPDLILWPEASFPGYFNRDTLAADVGELAKSLSVPMVVGAPHLEDAETAFNSAYLLGRDGTVVERYDKLFLVPFGEYVPIQPVFGWLEPVAESLGIGDFKAGRKRTVFKLQNGELPFSVLICFEDSFPNLARGFAEAGARFLAVLTNDAWFGPSAAPYQHLQASQFRAVENGMPVVRAANTGISAFISPRGEVLDRVEDREGRDIFVMGKKTYPVPIRTEPTLYRRGGWVFPYLISGVFVIMLGIRILRERGRG